MPLADATWDAFGRHLRTQRQLAKLSLRQLAELTQVSNPYLSQIERGLHQPSIAVVKALAEALNLSAESLLVQAAGITGEETVASRTDQAIRHDPRLERVAEACAPGRLPVDGGGGRRPLRSGRRRLRRRPGDGGRRPRAARSDRVAPGLRRADGG